MERLVRHEAQRLEALRTRPVMAQPERLVSDRAEDVQRLVDRSRTALASALTREADVVGHLRARVRSLSPQHTLDRGYAVVQRAGEVIRRADQVNAGDALDILVAAGRIGATTTDTHTPESTSAEDHT